MSALSIVVRQTMACWRHHFPLLCVKQCNADVSTFHCVSLHTETHFVPDPHMEHVETDSVWRVIEGKWCFGSGIRIRYPDHHQNLMEWSLGSWLPSHYISLKSVHYFLSNPANRQTNKQTNERALRECILCKIGLTDWVIYLVDWQWQRSRTQSIVPNDSNERCAMSIVLFRINIAAITENTWPWPFTFDLDLWPWYLTLRLICDYLDALKKTLQKFIVLTSRDAKTAPHMLERRPTYWLVFCQ